MPSVPSPFPSQIFETNFNIYTMLKGESSSINAGMIINDENRAIIDPFGHSWKCTSVNCLYNFCWEIKKLISSTSSCKHSVLSIHSCEICRELTYFLQQHRDNCNEAECDIPSCGRNIEQRTRVSDNVEGVVGSCHLCAHDVKIGQGWYCKHCIDFHVCDPCYKKAGVFNHPHRLITLNKKAEKEAEQKMKDIMKVLAHCLKCQSRQCHPTCRKMMNLFHHGKLCKVRSSGGCPLCNKMWYILQFHAESCTETNCSFSRCQELKEHLRKYYPRS